MKTIDATDLSYKQLNDKLFNSIDEGERQFRLTNVNGQRYIAAGCSLKDLKIEIEGTPGNDLGAFMNGPTITVKGNVQDQTGNTMNYGRIIVQGDARDVTGHSMRGGMILVKGNIGYRVGLHMKAFGNNFPIIIAGGKAGDFLGEYMAGGILIILGLFNGDDERLIGDWTGTGMHAGVIYVKGSVSEDQLGYGAKLIDFTEDDRAQITPILKEYGNNFGMKMSKINKEKFTKIVPVSYRPYGKLYALKI
jgi:glutamate synthase domain-containing protein 3